MMGGLCDVKAPDDFGTRSHGFTARLHPERLRSVQNQAPERLLIPVWSDGFGPGAGAAAQRAARDRLEPDGGQAV